MVGLPLQSLLLPLVFISQSVLAQSSPPPGQTCQSSAEPAATQAKCDAWRSQGHVLATYPDGSMVPNPNSLAGMNPHEELRPFARESTPANVARTEANIRGLVESMIEQVRAGRAESELNENQRYLLRRLRTITIHVGVIGQCTYAMNATYSSTDNQVSACPLFSQLPTSAQLPVLAHELAHLVDPCNYSDEYEKIGTIDNSRIASCLNPSGQSSPTIDQDVGMVQRLFRQSGPDSIGVQVIDMPRYQPLFQKLVDCGMLRTPSTLAPRTYSGHPYMPVLSCVTGRYPRVENRANLPPKQRDIVFPTPQSVNDSSRISSESSACHDLVGQAGEAIADHIAAALVNFHLKRSPPLDSAQKQWLSFFVDNMQCSNRNSENPSYPRAQDRLETFLQITETRSARQCQGDVAWACADSVRQMGAPTGSSRATPVRSGRATQ